MSLVHITAKFHPTPLQTAAPSASLSPRPSLLPVKTKLSAIHLDFERGTFLVVNLDRLRACGRAIVNDVWNNESHAAAFIYVPKDFVLEDEGVTSSRRGPLLMLDLLHLYKSSVPDLKFVIRRENVVGNNLEVCWSARGNYSFRSLGDAIPGRTVALEGSFVLAGTSSRKIAILASDWACTHFASLVGASTVQLGRALRPILGKLRVRARPGSPSRPLVLFPTLSLPGWIGWRHFLREYGADTQVLTFQSLANRWALEARERVHKYSLRSETRAFEEWLTAQRISTPFDVVAHSAGASIALDFALRNASSVRTLTLIEPSIPWVVRSAGLLDAGLEQFLRLRQTFFHPRITKRDYARFIQQLMGPTEGRDPRSSALWPELSLYRENMSFRKALYRHQGDLRKLRHIQCPVLLIKGDQSHIFYHRVATALEAAIPGARIVEMRGGHAPHFREGLASFMTHLSQFLSGSAPD